MKTTWLTPTLVGLVGIFLLRESVGAASPSPRTIEPFKKFQHQVSSGKVTLLDTRRIKIEGFRYDGGASNAFFWVGQGTKPNRNGTPIPNEKGKHGVLQGYNREDIILTLPSDLSFNDIDYLSVWCKRYNTDFGHVLIPKNLNLPRY